MHLPLSITKPWFMPSPASHVRMQVPSQRDGRIEVTHVDVDRIAEHQQLDHRDANDHAKCQPVAAQLPDLLPDNGKYSL